MNKRKILSTFLLVAVFAVAGAMTLAVPNGGPTNLHSATAKMTNAEIKMHAEFGGGARDLFNDVVVLDGGGFVAVGQAQSTDGDMDGISKSAANRNDAIIVRYDTAGEIVWKAAFGGTDNDYFHGVTQTADGNIIAVGQARSSDGDLTGIAKGISYDAVFVKYNTDDGAMMWAKTFGGTSLQFFNAVTVSECGGFVAVGTSFSANGDMEGLNQAGRAAAVIAKFDTDGDLVWANTSTRPENGLNDQFRAVTQTSDGGFVAVGDSYRGSVQHSTTDAMIFKFDVDGEIVWSDRLDGGEYHSINRGVAELACGAIIATCMSNSGEGDFENLGTFGTYLTKYGTDGERLWIKRPTHISRFGIAPTADGGFVTSTGRRNVKFDSNGERVWFVDTNVPNSPTTFFQFDAIAKVTDAEFVGVGSRFGGDIDFAEENAVIVWFKAVDAPPPTNGGDNNGNGNGNGGDGPNIPAIVGGIIGGVVGVCAIGGGVAAAVILMRRKKAV